MRYTIIWGWAVADYIVKALESEGQIMAPFRAHFKRGRSFIGVAQEVNAGESAPCPDDDEFEKAQTVMWQRLRLHLWKQHTSYFAAWCVEGKSE